MNSNLLLIIPAIFIMLLPGKNLGEDSGLSNDSIDIAMVLWRGTTEAEQGFIDGFKGAPVRFSIYDCKQDNGELGKIRSKLLKTPPALIYAFGTTVTVTLAGQYNSVQKNLHITNTPIVFSVVADPQGAGIIPKGSTVSNRNVTGVSHLVPIDVQLKAIQSVITVKSIGVLYNPDEQNSRIQVNELTSLSITRSISLVSIPITLEKDGQVSDEVFTTSLNKIISSKVDVLYLPSDSYIISQAGKIVATCHSMKIPTFSATEQPIREKNAFMGMVSRYYSVGAFAAYKAQQILEGTPPGKILCEKVPKYSLLINMQACKILDLYPPITMLRFAEIITPLETDSVTIISSIGQ